MLSLLVTTMIRRPPSPAEVRRGNDYLSPQPTPPAVELSDIWINPSGGNLIAKVSVTIPRWGVALHSCAVVRTKVGKYFVFPPSSPMVGRDGVVLKDDGGKIKYSPAVVFTKDTGRRFSDAVLEELKRRRPDAFEERAA